VAAGSGAARGVASGGAEPGGAESEGAETGGAEPRGVETRGGEPGGTEPEGVEPGGAASKGAESGEGAASSGGSAGASPRLSPQQLREWFVRRARLRSGSTGAGAAGAAGAGGAGVAAGAGDTGAVDPGGTSGGLTQRREPASRPVSTFRTALHVAHSRPPPVPGTPAMTLRPSFVPMSVPLPAPPESSLPEVPDPESDRARTTSPTVSRLLANAVTDPSFESAVASALVAELLDYAAACRLDYTTALVAESVSGSPPSVGGECGLGTDVLEDKHEDFECLAAAVPHFASMLLAPEGDPDALDIPTPPSYAEAITGPYSSQWQAAMDAEMASWKSTSTYVVNVPPPGANIVNGMSIFRVKRPPGSSPAFNAHYVARSFSQQQGVHYFQTFSPTPKMTTLRVLLHVAAQRDYELHSLDFSIAFLQGSLHEEIWLRRPPGFTGSFLAGTQWSLRRPVYGLRQAPREWHDTLRTTLAALGFSPSTADPSLFLRTDTTLPPFYVLVYVDDLFSSPQPTPLSTGHSLSAPPLDESVEPSGPYPELLGCLMYLMTCTRPDLAYPLSLLARYVAPGRHWKVHLDGAKRVLRYLCSTSGMGLVLGGRGPVVLTVHADASWVDDSTTQRLSQGYTFSLGSGSVSWRSTRSSSVLSSSCEAEIYTGAMAAQELHWLTYLLTDLGEQPRSPPVLYVDNKAMIALCQEHRQEHRTKHITLPYFLARELQQRGQLRLVYVATRANTADIFTKALPPAPGSSLARAGAAGAGAVDPRAGGAGDSPPSPLPPPSPYTEQYGGLTERREHASRTVSPIPTAHHAPRSRPPPVPGTHTMALRPSSFPLRVPLPAPPESSLPEVPNPASDRARTASPTVTPLLATVVTDHSFESAAASALVVELLDFAAACRLNYTTALVAESESATPPSVGGECALGTDVLEDRYEDVECLAAAVPRFASLLLAPEGDPDAPDIPTPRFYAEAITGPYSSQWQAAMDAEMASWKSTGTYVNAVPPQRQGVDYFQNFSPTSKITALRVLLHVAAQRDYELHSLDFSTAFLQGSLHEEIWLRRPPGFTGTFLAADPSLFLRTDTSLPPFYVLVQSTAHHHTDSVTHGAPGPSALRLPVLLATSHSSVYQPLTPSDESVEPGGLYPELVGCLMYLMTRTRPDLAYPLSLLARYVAPGRHRKVHWDAAKRVLRYLCSTLGMGLVLRGRSPVVFTGHADASWVDDSATQRSSQGYTFSLGSGSISWRSTCSSLVLSSSCEAEIYAGAMAAQELRWLTYLLTGLGEQPRSPPVLYVDNKAMIALCQEHRLEHRTKHIALRYFLARELQQRGQLRLAYVATRANTADVFTKALPPGDHQRFVTVLGLVPTLPHLLTA
ncbi:unnamed protein product, partial [Closterium sp. NIES-54]